MCGVIVKAVLTYNEQFRVFTMITSTMYLVDVISDVFFVISCYLFYDVYRLQSLNDQENFGDKNKDRNLYFTCDCKFNSIKK